MRAVIQRVTRAQVSVAGEVVGAIGRGYLVLLGVGDHDGPAEVERLWNKIFTLRIMADEAGKTNRSIADVGGSVLVVSQFTLFADCRRGRRPSFTQAGSPERARALYELFVDTVRADLGEVACGVFGADMAVELVNDGPFTIVLDTDEL